MDIEPHMADAPSHDSHPPLIQLRALSKAYDLRPVLKGIDLEIGRGECVALLGANGSGKSTLLRLLAGMTKPSGGAIRVGGWDIPREAAAVRAQIGLVSHKPLLYDNLTARENLRFFARLYDIDAVERETRIEALLTRVGLARRADDRVRTFSRGMQQRLSIARALVHDPAVVLLDEPYTGLDQEGAAMLDAVIAEAYTGGRTLILTTHELERAARIARRTLILARGQIGYDAPTAKTDALGLIRLFGEITGMTRERER